MSEKVTIFLDVDGVINAVGDPAPEQMTGWSREGWKRVKVDGWRITYHPDVIAELNALAARDDVTFVWLTTWLDKANGLARRIGLEGDKWEVCGADEYAAEQPQHWWKVDAISGWWSGPSRTHFVWIDDDIRYAREALDWLEGVPSASYAAISPSTSIGLTRRQIDTVRDFLDEGVDR